MYRFSTVANVLAELSRFLLLECMEQIEPDNPNEICYNLFHARTLRATTVVSKLKTTRSYSCIAGPVPRRISARPAAAPYLRVLRSAFAMVCVCVCLCVRVCVCACTGVNAGFGKPFIGQPWECSSLSRVVKDRRFLWYSSSQA